MNKTLLTNPSEEGYLLVPRLLLKEICCKREKHPMCEEEAILTLLYLAYYKESVRITSRLNRGDINIGFSKWRKIFCWTDFRTRKFFNDLEEIGFLIKIRLGNKTILHLKNYDLYCANKKPKEDKPGGKPENLNEQMFREFWMTYHELTNLPMEDEAKARRFWKYLSLQEKHMAIHNIVEYIMQTGQGKYLKKAANYLADKSFMNID